LEIGAGHEHHIQKFREIGVTRTAALEYENLRESNHAGGESFIPDSNAQINPEVRFDLVLCADIINQFAENDLPRLVSAISNHASRAILISEAANNPGRETSSLEMLHHWIKEFQGRGWVPLVFQSLAFRACATLTSLRSIPVIFVRAEEKSHFQKAGFSLADLERQANIPWNWREQKSGFYLQP
jgi:hypothetical protein